TRAPGALGGQPLACGGSAAEHGVAARDDRGAHGRRAARHPQRDRPAGRAHGADRSLGAPVLPVGPERVSPPRCAGLQGALRSEHGPLERLEDNLWRVEGALPNMALRRVMTVVRMADGRLVIHSAIALPDELMAQIEAWGRPSYLLVPNAYHRLDAPAYKAR